MDIGKFKASRGRYIAWILLPPLLILSAGLTSFALKKQSDWKLERTRVLADILPKLVSVKKDAEELVNEFDQHSGGQRLQSEDELISFLQTTAAGSDFTVDSLKVERRVSAGTNIPVLTANVRGSGTFTTVQDFMGDVTSKHHLLSESALSIKQGGGTFGKDHCQADITFELILFKPAKSGGGA